MELTVITIVLGAFGTVSKGLEKILRKLKIRVGMETIQPRILKSGRISLQNPKKKLAFTQATRKNVFFYHFYLHDASAYVSFFSSLF